MPKAVISTYSVIPVNQFGGTIEVSKIISEQDNVPNLQKEVNFGKFSKKLMLHNKVASTDVGRE